ncbi:MAG TPA: PEGA domain-containing protein [Acidobacteriota bacterium]|nr:PEGA domain-containing protein [Acidobacteriota bacterium]
MMKKLLGLIVAAAVFTSAAAQDTAFKKVELRTDFGTAQQGREGILVVSASEVKFANKGGAEYFSIPTEAITDLFYSRVSGRRIKTAIVVSPLLLFSKGKKHYLTVSFDDGQEMVGAVEFKLHKSNYRGVLRSVEAVSNVTLQFDQEGIKDEKETIATRSGAADESMAVLRLESVPEGAEIEIDGAYAGAAPRTKRLKPGSYKIKFKKKGYKDWERKIEVEAGESLTVRAEMEEK